MFRSHAGGSAARSGDRKSTGGFGSRTGAVRSGQAGAEIPRGPGHLNAPEVDPQSAVAFRLRRGLLLEPEGIRGPADAVRRLVGIQSQVASASYLGLWTRLHDLKQSTLERALAPGGSLVRTWCMRGTVHLVTRRDVPLLAAALGPAAGGVGPWLRRSGLTDSKYSRARTEILQELEQGPRTRTELAQALGPRIPGIDGFFGSWGGILRLLAQEGLIVFGPGRNGETTFTIFAAGSGSGKHAAGRSAHEAPFVPADEAAGSSASVKAMSELLRRYLAVHAPATPMDFAYWTGRTGRAAKAARDVLGDDVVEVRWKGGRAWALRTDLSELASSRLSQTGGGRNRRKGDPHVRLLPFFDLYLLAHRDKSEWIDRRWERLVRKQAGWIAPVILVNGRALGTWSHERKGETLHLRLQSFEPLDRAIVRKAEAEARAMAPFLGAKRTRIEAG